MEPMKLYESEYRFAQLVWDHEPLTSGQLAALCREELGWKKSTAYTVLKRLCERGILQNERAVVTSLVKRDQVLQYESEQLIDRVFNGSLPSFLTAFMGGRKISEEEAEELKRLIDSHKEV